MTDIDRKARVREYTNAPRLAGVFAVWNTETGRMLVGATLDLPGMRNRQKFQLNMGSHPDKKLQSDWKALGERSFVFEIVDQLDLKEDANADPANDLRALKAMWLDKLVKSGTPLYPWSQRG